MCQIHAGMHCVSYTVPAWIRSTILLIVCIARGAIFIRGLCIGAIESIIMRASYFALPCALFEEYRGLHTQNALIVHCTLILPSLLYFIFVTDH